MNQKKNNLLLIEINECDFDYFIEGAKKFKYQNIINYFQRKKNIKTFTHDKQEGLNLDPWVQWVSVHTGLHSEQHQVYRIGQKLNDEIKNELQKLNYDVQVINPATCLQLIMKKNNTFYGYGDFRRPDAFASGDIYD